MRWDARPMLVSCLSQSVSLRSASESGRGLAAQLRLVGPSRAVAVRSKQPEVELSFTPQLVFK